MHPVFHIKTVITLMLTSSEERFVGVSEAETLFDIAHAYP
jgi:hypothetical protein